MGPDPPALAIDKRALASEPAADRVGGMASKDVAAKVRAVVAYVRHGAYAVP
jgi:hypothetical protein